MPRKTPAQLAKIAAWEAERQAKIEAKVDAEMATWHYCETCGDYHA